MLSYKKNPDYQNLVATPRWAYLNRRHLLKGGILATLAWWAKWPWAQMNFSKSSQFSVNDPKRPLTKPELAYSYNNFYEFSLDKNEPAKLAKNWKIDSWNLDVGGLVKRPTTLKLKDLYEMFPLEERVYRFRCVEAWSMVLPWVGFPLAKLVEKVQPKPEAKFVRFTTLSDPKVMPNIKNLPDYPWPYTEGLTLEEAQHPLSFLAVGLYGERLKGQNGAPIRLVVPWKYGFKSIKSLVKIEFVAEQPKTLWSTQAPGEYGFYANVNPQVSHPRWSQASERVVDGALFPKRVPTLMFNGYENEVKGLYAGLDLVKNF